MTKLNICFPCLNQSGEEMMEFRNSLMEEMFLSFIYGRNVVFNFDLDEK